MKVVGASPWDAGWARAPRLFGRAPPRDPIWVPAG